MPPDNTYPLPLPRPCSNSPSAEEGESTAEEGVSGEGASSQGRGRMEDLDSESSESNLDMTEVWPPVPPATREAPAAEPGAEAEGAIIFLARRIQPFLSPVDREVEFCVPTI